MRNLTLFSLLILFVTSVAAFDIEALRAQQDIELLSNQDSFRQKYISNNIKEGSPEDTKILGEYSKSRQKIIDKYTSIDSYRRNIVSQTIKSNNGNIVLSGSMPQGAGADVDYATLNMDAYNELNKKWEKRGDNVIDEGGYRSRNATTDEVSWKPDADLTPTQRAAKKRDRDSYVTKGGLKSTGVRSVDVQSSPSGSGLDPMRKLVFGMQDNNLKDVGKSLIKVSNQADGVDIVNRSDDGLTITKELSAKQIKDNKLLSQAKKLKGYKDPIEAGIVRLSDSPDIAKAKIEKFKKDSLELGVKKQIKLDTQNVKKEKMIEALIDSLPKGSETKQNIQERLDLSRESNKLARQQLQDTIKDMNIDVKLQNTSLVEQNKALKPTNNADNKIQTEKQVKPKSDSETKKFNIQKPTAIGAAGFIATVYQMNESREGIIKSGGNDFIQINKNDSNLMKNAKAITAMGIESTTFGGAYSAGKRADDEEKKRIMDATKKGKTINPVVSFMRASFWGLAYTVKDATLGTLEYTKDKLLEVDKEIKLSIKSSVEEKYAAIEKKKTKQLLKNKELVKNKPKKKKVFFFEDNEDNEYEYLRKTRDDRKRQEYSDNLQVKQKSSEYNRRQARARAQLASGLQDLQQGLIAVKQNMDADKKRFNAQIKNNNDQYNRVVKETIEKNDAYKGGPNNYLRQAEQEVLGHKTGYMNPNTSASYKATTKTLRKPRFVDNTTIQPRAVTKRKVKKSKVFYLVIRDTSMVPQMTPKKPKTYITKTSYVCAIGPFSTPQQMVGKFIESPDTDKDGNYIPKKSCLKRP